MTASTKNKEQQLVEGKAPEAMVLDVPENIKKMMNFNEQAMWRNVINTQEILYNQHRLLVSSSNLPPPSWQQGNNWQQGPPPWQGNNWQNNTSNNWQNSSGHWQNGR